MPAGVAAAVEERQHHHGLAKAHVVGQAPAEVEAAQELEPAESLALILAQRPAKRRRRVGGSDAAKTLQLGADVFEQLVVHNRGLRRQQRIEKGGLRSSEPDRVTLGLSESGNRGITAQPLLREQAYATVVEYDDVFAAGYRREELREGRRPAVAEIDVAVQIEPVDPRRHLQLHADRRPERPAFRLDAPALVD